MSAAALRRPGRWLGLALAAAIVALAAPPWRAGAAAEACTARFAGFPNPSMLSAMARGVNLPDWNASDPARRPKLAQLQALRDRGFTHVRLPLDNRPLGGADSGEYLDALYEEIVLLLSLDFRVSVDLHPDGAIGELFRRDTTQATRALVELWEKIAPRLRSFDATRVAVELLNEPAAEPGAWREAASALIPAVRRILPDTTIVVGPAGPQRHETLAGMAPFDDPNIVYAVHYYDPMAFTHQGADWTGDDDPLAALRNVPFPARLSDPAIQGELKRLRADGRGESADALTRQLDEPWDETMIARVFDMMDAWSRRTGRPVIVNEFGVLASHAPRESRLAWLAAVRQAAEARCIGWAHWDFDSSFGLIDDATGLPDAGLMQALVPR